MEKITPEDFRNKLETSSLQYTIINLNKKILRTSNEFIWNYRYFRFLNAMLSEESLPINISLKELIEFTLHNKSDKLTEYLEYLPALRLPLKENQQIPPEALQIHEWMILMFNEGYNEYEKSINNDKHYKLEFKELNRFTFSNKHNHIHIQSNTLNISDFDWTIISTEYNNELFNKNIRLENEEKVEYYLRNYEELKYLKGQDANTMIEIALI